MMMINIVDAPCGMGKTSWAIQYMNGNDERRFIFVTPFKDETKRIVKDCRNRNFATPSNKGKTKSADLKRLLERGANIAATHELFRRVDQDTIELIKLGGYTLILDEVMDVVQDAMIKKDDIKMLRDQGLIEVTEEGTVVAADRSYQGRLDDILFDARMDRLIYVDNKMLMWQFPANIFEAFDDAYVLTYMFDGQIQKYYYDYHNIKYQYYGVQRKDDRFVLTGSHDDREFRRQLSGLLNVYDGKLNTVGRDPHSLSVSWYHKKSRYVLKNLRNNLYNYFRHGVGAKAKTIMWACFKDQQKVLNGNGYTRGFVRHNARATNQYRDRSNLAYMVNRYARTPITRYFQTKGIKIDQDRYALSELIQWIWRSRVRDGLPVNLYVPSSRMRNLLTSWVGTPG